MDLEAQLRAHFSYLNAVNDEIGHPDHAREKQARFLSDQLSNAMKSQMEELQNEKDDLLSGCLDMEAEIAKWKTAVGNNVEPENGSLDGEERTGLIGRFKALRSEREAVHKIYQKRLEIVQHLRLELDVFRPSLGNFIPTLQLGDNDSLLLSTDSIAKLEDMVRICREEMARRKERIDSLASAVVSLWTEMGEKPKSVFDRFIMEHQHASEAGQRLTESEENISKLESKKKKLEARKQHYLSKIATILAEINRLWDEFSVPEAVRCQALEEGKEGLVETVRLYEDHLKDLRELKKKNVGTFIQPVREELERLWDELLLSEDERRAFAPAFCPESTAESLTAHQAEVERLKRCRDELKPVLDLVNKHREMLAEWTEVEDGAKDSARLTQRGTKDLSRLLREEKIRKRFAKGVPKLEAELESLLQRWEARHKKPFLVHGVRHLDTMRGYKRERKEKNSTPATKTPMPPCLNNPSLTTSTFSPLTLSSRPSPTPTKPLSTPSSPSNGFRRRSASKPPPPPSASVPSTVQTSIDGRPAPLNSKIPILKPTPKTSEAFINVPASAVTQTPRGARRKSNSFSGGSPNLPAALVTSRRSPGRIEVEMTTAREYHGSTDADSQTLPGPAAVMGPGMGDGDGVGRENGRHDGGWEDLFKGSVWTDDGNDTGKDSGAWMTDVEPERIRNAVGARQSRINDEPNGVHGASGTSPRVAGSRRKIRMLKNPTMVDTLNDMNAALDQIEQRKLASTAPGNGPTVSASRLSPSSPSTEDIADHGNDTDNASSVDPVEIIGDDDDA